MEGQVPEKERLRRLHVIQELQRGITAERSTAQVSTTQRVLVTGAARRPGQQAARTEGNRMVILEGTEYPPGTFVDVCITAADGWTHFAEPLTPDRTGN